MKQGQLFPTESATATDSSIAINKIHCKTILSKSGLYGIDFSINPYTGCEHHCTYCFARSMFERWGNKRPWGKFVDVKVNAPAILTKQLRRITTGTVLISSVTDPYQPVEAHFRLTRRLLSLLSGKKFQVFILTKSSLVTRDVDIFQENPHWEIGLTLTTADDTVQTLVEPQASSTEERIGALRLIKDAGVNTYAFLGPLLPFISENTLPELLDALAEAKVSHVMIDRLNIRGSSVKRMAPVVRKILPDKAEEFFEASKQNSSYFNRLKTRVRKECVHRGLELDFCY
ncbi:MAG: radical SAM protein [Candidatus Thorarchaeota archaeon]